jgi:hypothetical protein
MEFLSGFLSSPFFYVPHSAGVIAALIFLWRNRGESFSKSSLTAGAVCFLSGVLVCIYMFGHTTVNIVNAVMGTTGENGDQPFRYNFRFYSLISLGICFFWLGLNLLRLAKGVAQNEPAKNEQELKTCLLMIVFNLPLISIQPGSAFFSAYAAISFSLLVFSRRVPAGNERRQISVSTEMEFNPANKIKKVWRVRI